jgi:hypothetical protein
MIEYMVWATGQTREQIENFLENKPMKDKYEENY